tara:strand:+ start:5881 stop:6951 length:1071 start_codon:yes stop_codon:yes gene_type:complete
MKIHPVNHACLLIESNGKYILTDPWPISPAFGGWHQSPSPAYADIQKIININPEDLVVVISHGHDDHFDDYFCKRYLSKSTVVIPQHINPGLRSRASKSFNNVVEVGMRGSQVGEAYYRAFINSDYTNHDAIVTIEVGDSVVIHANDNWHPQEKEHLKTIKSLCKDKNSSYYSQIGIADCFPSHYPEIPEEDKLSIIRNRLATQITSVKNNFRTVGADSLFCYANQAKILGSSISPYEILQELLEHEESITQIRPSEGVGYLSALVKEQESVVASKVSGDLQVRFFIGLPSSKPEKNEVYYCADEVVWRRIFSGQLTLESLGIGGMGTIISNPTLNIREAHYIISKYAYQLQNKIT